METRTGIRIALLALALAVAAGVGVLVGLLGTDGRLSYTDPRGNPSTTGEPAAPGAPIVATAAPARKPAEPMAFADAEGRKLDLEAFRGKVVLVNLWATWCPPCVAEMPSLDALQKRLGGKEFQVVPISLDRGGAAIVRRWYDKAGIGHLGLYTADAAQFVNALLPTSILIDAQGRVAWRGTGAYDWDGEEARGVIKALVAEGG